MLGGIDEAARDVRRRSWKYLECSITCAASFCGRKQHTKAVRSSGSSSSSTRLGGGGASTFSVVPSSRRSNEHEAAMMAALLREVV